MRKIACVLSSLPCVGHAMTTTSFALHSDSRSSQSADLEALAILLMAFEPAAAFHHSGPRLHCCDISIAMHASFRAAVVDRRSRDVDAVIDSDDLPRDLNSLTVKKLKVLLKDRGLKVSGRKPELVERLDALRDSQSALLETMAQPTRLEDDWKLREMKARMKRMNDVVQEKEREEFRQQMEDAGLTDPDGTEIGRLSKDLQEEVKELMQEPEKELTEKDIIQQNLPFGVTLVTQGWDGYEERVDSKTGKTFWVRVAPLPGASD